MPFPKLRSNKLRTGLLVAGSVVVIAVIAVVLVNLAGSGDGDEKPAKVANDSGLTLEYGPVNVQSAGPPAKISKSVRQSVLDASQAYVDDAVLSPVEKGKLVAAYEKMFDPGIQLYASGRDRAALTEVRTGALPKPVKASATKVSLDGLGDQTGKLVLVAATFGVTVDAKGVKIQRLVELTFAEEHGKWVVTAYNVGVKRSAGASTTSAVANAGHGGTA